MDTGAGDFLAGLIIATIISCLIPPASVNMEELKASQRLCEANGSLNYYRPHGLLFREAVAVCNNGAKFSGEEIK